MSDGSIVGAVLAGGRSSRMGADKATLVVDGTTLARRAVDALLAAGIDRVVVVGGEHDFGVELLADDHPGDGPVGGVLSALAAAAPADVVVLPCDLPLVGASDIARLLAAAARQPDADVTVATIDGRPAWPIAYWRRRGAPRLVAAFDLGERSFGGATRALAVGRVELGAAVADADVPGDLPTPGTLATGEPRDHGGEG